MKHFSLLFLCSLFIFSNSHATTARLERFYWDCHEKSDMRLEIILDGEMTVFYADCESDFRAVVESESGVDCQAYSPMCSRHSSSNSYLYLTCEDGASDTLYIPCPTDSNGHNPPRH